MKKCTKCNVEINSSRMTCPLCGQILENDKDVKDYPSYPKTVAEERHINILLRILLFLSIVSIVSTVIVNLLTYTTSWWSFYVVISIIYVWILLRSTIMSKRNIARRLLVQLIALSCTVIIIERLSESKGWALDYVVPFACIITNLAIVIILFIKQMRFNDYLLYLLVTIIISWAPMILYWTKVIKVLWPSISAAGVAFITVVGMIIFADTATKDELRKRFHL